MTWKSYVLTGAGVVATWLAAATPSHMPANVAPVQPREAAGAVAAASDIEEQAAHLQARLQQESLYREPGRNLFTFGHRPVAAVSAGAETVTPALPEPPQPIAPAPPAVKLVGIADDGQAGNGGAGRTAILTTPTGVVLVHAGDDVIGLFRVSTVDADAVNLVSLTDGVALRLPLR